VAPPPRLSSTGAEREPSTTRSILRDMRHVACGRPQLAAAWPLGGGLSGGTPYLISYLSLQLIKKRRCLKRLDSDFIRR
jgi:hypothetical protein